MSNGVNKFLAELQSIVQAGFSVNGVNFLGNELKLTDFKSNLVDFDVRTERGSLGNEVMGPVIIIHEHTPDSFRTVGKRSLQYDFFLDFFFNDGEFEKTVNGDKLSGVALARYIQEHLNDAFDIIRPQFSTVNVYSVNTLPSGSQTGRIENTDIMAGRVRFSVRFR